MKDLLTRAAVRDGLLPCLREDPQLWFSDRPAELELAKAHCQPCPLRGACLDGALARREPHGVWGGEIFERGTIIARKVPRGRPPTRSRGTPCTQTWTEKLAAERIRDIAAQGADARRARQARQARAARRSGQAPAPRPGTQPVVPLPRESQENHVSRSTPGRPGAGR